MYILVYILNKIGAKMLLCIIPVLTSAGLEWDDPISNTNFLRDEYDSGNTTPSMPKSLKSWSRIFISTVSNVADKSSWIVIDFFPLAFNLFIPL